MKKLVLFANFNEKKVDINELTDTDDTDSKWDKIKKKTMKKAKKDMKKEDLAYDHNENPETETISPVELQNSIDDAFNFDTKDEAAEALQKIRVEHPEVKTDSVLKNIWWTAIKKYHNRFDY